MKKILVLISTIGVFLGTGIAFAATNIGVFDLQKVLQSAPQVAAMQAKLQDQFAARGKEVAADQKTLQSDVDKFRNMPAVKVKERQGLQKQILTEQQSLQNKQNTLQNDFLTARNQQLQDVLGKVKKAAATIAQQKGLDLVIANTNIAYSAPGMDITDSVINALKK